MLFQESRTNPRIRRWPEASTDDVNAMLVVVIILALLSLLIATDSSETSA